MTGPTRLLRRVLAKWDVRSKEGCEGTELRARHWHSKRCIITADAGAREKIPAHPHPCIPAGAVPHRTPPPGTSSWPWGDRGGPDLQSPQAGCSLEPVHRGDRGWLPNHPAAPKSAPRASVPAGRGKQGGDGVEGDRVSRRLGSRDGEEPSATRTVLAGEQRWVTSSQINLG